MKYNSIEFIYFVACSFILFSFLPIKFRKKYLLILSIIWYISIDLKWTFIITFIALLNFITLKNILNKDRIISYLIFFNVFIFFILKCFSNEYFGLSKPFAFSFLMMGLIGQLIEYKRNLNEIKILNFSSFYLDFFYFPTLIAGPIERKRVVSGQLDKLKNINYYTSIDGILLFVVGFLKWNYLHPVLFNFKNNLFTSSQASVLNIFVASFINCFLAYIDFSTFADMGRGISKIFNIEISLNFRPFYYAKNPNDFWKRWNITLATWLRDFFTMPLLLNYGRKININVIIFISFLLMGFWHGNHLNWLIFGIYNGLIIIVYNVVLRRFANYSKIIGYFLVIMIFLLSGFFQEENSINLLILLSKKFEFGFSHFLTNTQFNLHQEFNSLHFLIILFIFLIFEYYQEKKGVDFFMSFSKEIKWLFLIVIIISFYYVLNSGFFLKNLPEEVPIYFTL